MRIMEFIIISLLVVIIAAVLLCKRSQTAYTAPNDSGPLPASQNTLDQELQTRMKEFIRDDRFVLVVQPVMDLKKNSIAGGEVLSRLNHPERGVIFPDNFLPAVAAAGLYSEFDKYIFRKCCAWHSRSRAEGAGMELVSCNFSRKTLSEPDIASQLVQIADSYGLPHSSLGIELMEQEAETDVTQFYGNLKKLKGSGFRIILDDFGDGVTSVKDIMSKPLDIVKIDRSVLLAADNDQVKAAYRSMVEMAEGMGLEVVCEGIETEEQRRFAQDVGCHYGQGFLFYRPMSIDQVFEMIEMGSVAEIREEV